MKHIKYIYESVYQLQISAQTQSVLKHWRQSYYNQLPVARVLKIFHFQHQIRPTKRLKDEGWYCVIC